MAQAPLLTDDLLRQLMAVGHVDILVGLPTLNSATSVVDAMTAAGNGLGTYFPRQRTVVISADGGSRDGTTEIVREFVSGGAGRTAASGGLRTRHHITTTYRAAPGKADAVRLMLAAGELLQARAMVFLDPDVTSLTPAWIASLVGAVWQQSVDFVAPLYDRHPLEVPLLTQLLRPVLRAAYGRRIQEPLIGEFGCSGRFAIHSLAGDVWDTPLAQEGVELWLTTSALEGDFRIGEVLLGPRRLAPTQPPRPGLREVFPHVIGSLFACLERQPELWLAREGSEALPLVGPPAQPVDQPPSIDPAKLGQTFCQDVHDLRPLLESILAPETLAAVWSAADAARAEAPLYPDELWTTTVYDFLAAHHSGVMGRTHVVQALMPLYLGRVASFLTAHAASGAADVALDLAELSLKFERQKPYLVGRWNGAS